MVFSSVHRRRGIGRLRRMVRSALTLQLLADLFHPFAAQFVERQQRKHAGVEHHWHNAEEDFDGGQDVIRLTALLAE
jgi:hypothetical protein